MATRSKVKSSLTNIPRGWTETLCHWPGLEGGHTRDVCQVLDSGGSLRCKFRGLETRRTRAEGLNAPVVSEKINHVHLECDHFAMYQVVTDLLYCYKCDDWKHKA